MQAAVGDRLHVHANVVGHPGRTGEIVEVRERAESRCTWCVSMTAIPRWCSLAPTRSSSIRVRGARRGRREARPDNPAGSRGQVPQGGGWTSCSSQC